MPGRDSPSRILDGVFDFLWSRGAEVVEEVASAIKPICGICGEPSYAPLPCLHCGRCACHKHGYFNLGQLKLICQDCGETGARAEEDLPEPAYPWDALGIQPTTDTQLINKAFRRQAGKFHADATAGTLQDQTVWASLRAAYDLALEMARGEHG